MIIKEYVKSKKEEMRKLISIMKKKPSIVIVQLNEDAASDAYVRGKLKDAEQLGVNAKLIRLPVDTSEKKLLKLVNKLNHDKKVDGFIVQMPLPKQINEETVKLAISPDKDVDGFHPLSSLDPCTPRGILNYLIDEGIELQGKNAVVIGRSNIVGKPMAKLLLSANCNVTVLHSKTPINSMKAFVKDADIIVIAIGKKWFLNKEFAFKESAVIIDVGINRDEVGLFGDAFPDLPVRLQTPVPGGVGLLTRTALYQNLLTIVNNKNK